MQPRRDSKLQKKDQQKDSLHNALEGGVVDSAGLLSDEVGLEQHLWAAEALVTASDDVSIGELVGLLVLACRFREVPYVPSGFRPFVPSVSYPIVAVDEIVSSSSKRVIRHFLFLLLV